MGDLTTWSRPSRRHVLGAGAAAVALGFGAAGHAQQGAAGAGFVATTGMVADAARAVLGPSSGVEITQLMGAGVDPHSYRETRADVAALLQAQAVFWNGHYLEAQLEPLLLELAQQKPTIAIAEAAPQDRLLAHEDYAGRFDPHIWMDPTLWAFAVDAARAALAEITPEQADLYAENAAAYADELTALDAYARETLGSVPEASRVLLTAHDAFGYFGAAYGFEVVGVQGVSTESEAGLARIGALVDLIVDRQIGAVFVESSVSARNIEALIEGARARGVETRIGAELFSDAMGVGGTYEGTYLGMIDHNVTAITRALGGSAPAGGRLGRLGDAA